MTPEAAERLRVYQEGRRSSTDDNAICPYQATNWRHGTWNKGRKAALEHWSEMAEIESRIAFLDQPVLEPKREWVGLNQGDIEWLYVHHARYQEEDMRSSGWDSFARAIEALLRGKNNG